MRMSGTAYAQYMALSGNRYVADSAGILIDSNSAENVADNDVEDMLNSGCLQANTSGTGGITATDGQFDLLGLAGTTNGAGGIVNVTGGAGNGTGAGGVVELKAGASGAGATGNGADAKVTGGAALSSNGGGGSVVLTPGAKAGTGMDGAIRMEGVILKKQPDPTALTTSATLTVAQMKAVILTANQGASAAATYTLPTGTLMDGGMPADVAVNDAFDWSLVNVSTVAAEDATVAAGTDHTVVGDMVVASNAAATDKSVGLFRSRRTAANTWVTYRIG